MSDEGIIESTKKYKQLEFYYWLGVVSATSKKLSDAPPIIVLCLMSGRSVTREILGT